MQINLNADLGESFGPWPMGSDERLLSVVNSANVACGFHAGDPLVMANTIKTAKDNQTSVGAHPGFPDLQGFGRRVMHMAESELYACVQYQLAAMDGLCRAHNSAMTHVKPHGAMNNMACDQAGMANTIAKAVYDYDSSQILLAPALSELAKAGEAVGLRVALEVFADRAYQESGSLVSRKEPGAVLSSAADCIQHVRNMIKQGGLVAQSGKVLATDFHSICVHGDNAHAVDTAEQLATALKADGHKLSTLADMIPT